MVVVVEVVVVGTQVLHRFGQFCPMLNSPSARAVQSVTPKVRHITGSGVPLHSAVVVVAVTVVAVVTVVVVVAVTVDVVGTHSLQRIGHTVATKGFDRHSSGENC